MSPASRRSATIAAIGSILLWCWSGVCYAEGSRAIGAMPYLALMTATGVATIVALQRWRGRPARELFRVPWRVIVAGFFGVTLYTILLAVAIGLAEERELGQVMLLNYLWPIWIVLLGIALLEDRPRPGLTVLGVMVAFGGLVVSRGVTAFARAPASWTPHGAAVAGGFLWALYCVLLRRWRIPAERGGSTFHFAVCAALAAAIAVVTGEWRQIGGLTPAVVFWILFGGVGPVGFAYYWWEIGVKRGSAPLLATLAYFTPIGSTMLICLFFREALGVGLLVGAVMIAAGAGLVHRAARTERQAIKTSAAENGGPIWNSSK